MKRINIDGSENGSAIFISDLEKKLEVVLKPVDPRSEWVFELKQNLYNPDYRKRYIESAEWMLLIAASFFSVFILLVIGIRSIIILISALGIIRHYKNNKIHVAKP